MKNRASGLLMETGVTYDKLRLHRIGYFSPLMSSHEEISDSVRPLLKLCRDHIGCSIRMDRALLRSLERDPERLRRLRTVPGLGPITALTWVLEVGDTSRFRSIKQAISYCGLCGAEKSSADMIMRARISKQRNKHIRIIRCAGCQVPQITAWAREATSEALFGLFRDWQRTQTQSSAMARKFLRQQMDGEAAESECIRGLQESSPVFRGTRVHKVHRAYTTAPFLCEDLREFLAAIHQTKVHRDGTMPAKRLLAAAAMIPRAPKAILADRGLRKGRRVKR